MGPWDREWTPICGPWALVSAGWYFSRLVEYGWRRLKVVTNDSCCYESAKADPTAHARVFFISVHWCPFVVESNRHGLVLWGQVARSGGAFRFAPGVGS